MILNDYLDYLNEGGATAVMGCRAAKHGLISLSRKLHTGQSTADQKIWMQRKIVKYKAKVDKCKKLGLMI